MTWAIALERWSVNFAFDTFHDNVQALPRAATTIFQPRRHSQRAAAPAVALFSFLSHHNKVMALARRLAD
jgi:hypothetical protein